MIPASTRQWSTCYTFLTRLRCVDLTHAQVYHFTAVSPSASHTVWWSDFLRLKKAQVSTYVMENSSDPEKILPESQPPAAVIIDDGTLAPETRMTLLRTYFSSHVEAGGYYFLQLPTTADEVTRKATAYATAYALYTLYCEPVLRPGQQSQRYINAKLCEEGRELAGVFQVGCSAAFCYLQKAPLHTPPLDGPSLEAQMGFGLSDDEVEAVVGVWSMFKQQ